MEHKGKGAGRACVWALCVGLLCGMSPAGAVTPPAGHLALNERITADINNILDRYGVSAEVRGRPRFSMDAFIDFVGGGGVMYVSHLDHARDLPFAVRAEIIEYFVQLYDIRGGHEYMRLQVRSGPRPLGLFKPKPEFELILNHTR